ncbi:alpha-hydroxy-acid oxidizing protein [Pseudaminobacter arsenicus]|uniref:Alpha-hydroxy-acid oxidizing protein n=1 Tax=Borborobacter arsenicus TaxID=1851146 RepID=A0A432V395_9HYPH|nr:alpha-hydroxy acid oxidase [Pseudaminobacter arsenicus]RUM96626.1 alpha-hydroxy-acid oxidizing protein [Pseudaminobacter arsenicus]
MRFLTSVAGSRSAYSIEDLRSRARDRLPRAVFDFFDGGAEDERALRANRAAYAGHRLVPYVLRDVSEISVASDILGKPSALPLAVGPTGAAGFGWRKGDIAIARAAAKAGIPYGLSTSATASIEEIAAAIPKGRRWFQAYILKNRAFTEKLIARARAAGFEALMITVDLPVGGKRERDYRNDFSIPFRFTRRNLLDFALHPKWSLPMLLRGVPKMPNLIGLDATATDSKALASSVGRNYDPSFDWDDLRRVRDLWDGKLIVKGVMRVSDAERVARLGCDALVVSNHGGRQLDAGLATLDALGPIASAVGSELEVMVDGGIRRGTDIVVALALGAKAVLIGRPTLYGMCANGEAGAIRALDILHDEFRRTMQLCGLTCVSQVSSDIFRTD